MSLVPARQPEGRSTPRARPQRSQSRGEPVSSRHTGSPSRAGDMIIVRKPEDSVLAVDNGETEAFPSAYARSQKDAHERPSSVTPYTKTFIKRFTSSASVPAKTSKNFTGTDIVAQVTPTVPCDVKCLELIDETQVWAANKDGSFTVYDRMSGAELRRTPQRDAVCWCMLEVKENVWCGFNDGFVRVLSKKDKSPVINLSRHTGPVTAVVPQQSGKYVFSASLDFTILQWDASDFSFAGRFVGHSAGVRSLAASVDRLYSGADDGSIRAWDTYNKDFAEWRGHTQAVKFLAVVESNVWSASDDGTVRVWSPSGKCLAILASPGKGPFTSLVPVGSTVWGSSVGGTMIWDACTRALIREIPSDGSGYVSHALIVAKNVVNRVWAVGNGGRIAAWNSETELRGDDVAAENEAEKRNEEIVYLRDALQDVQVQAAELQDQCNERLQRMEYDLQKARDEAEMRSCQIADLQAQLDQSRRDVAERDELISQRDIRNNADANKSVNRVMANHLQQTEKKLLEAETKIQKLQSELSKEQAVSERRAQRDSETSQSQSRALSQLQQAEIRNKELQRHCDELEESCRRGDDEINGLRDENVELAAKLDVSRKKIDEAQKVVAQHASEIKSSNKERAKLQALSQSLKDSQRETAPSSPRSDASPESPTRSPARTATKSRAKVMPILPPKPWVEKVVGYVRTVCASCTSVMELPEPMQQALRFEVVAIRDPSIFDLSNEDANDYVDSFLGPAEEPPELRGCLASGSESLTSGFHFALVLSTMRLYNPAWLSLSRRAQIAWYETNALFPSTLQVVESASKMVTAFTTHTAPRRAHMEQALKRSELMRAKPDLAQSPQSVLDRDGHVPTPVGLRITKDLQNGWRKLSAAYRRALVLNSVSGFMPDWESKNLFQQMDVFERVFKMPSFDEVSEVNAKNVSNREVHETGIYLLRAIVAMGDDDASPLASLPLTKLMDHGKMRCPPEIESAVSQLITTGNSHALSPKQRAALAIDLCMSFTAVYDNLTFMQARARFDSSSPKVEIKINDAEDLTANQADGVNSAGAARCDNWGHMSANERLDWVARYCVLPPLLLLRARIVSEWPPVNARPLAAAIMESLPTRGDSVATRMRRLDGPYGDLSSGEQQVVLREVFFTHAPAVEMTQTQREDWMQEHAVYPSYADAQPVLFALCEHGWNGLPPSAQNALLAETLPESDLPAKERYDMSVRFASDKRPEIESSLERGLTGLSQSQQDALHRWFLGGFVATWESMTVAQQSAWIQRKGLSRGGKFATLALVCDTAQGDNVPVPHLEALISRRRDSTTASTPAVATSEPLSPPRTLVRDSTTVRVVDVCSQFPERSNERSFSYSRPAPPSSMPYVLPQSMTWTNLADCFGVDVDALRAENPDVPQDSDLAAGSVVKMPRNTKPHVVPANGTVAALEGDTPQSVASRYGVTVDDVIALNPQLLRDPRMRAADPIALPAIRGSVHERDEVAVNPSAGDTLQTIAAKHDTTPAALRRLNPSLANTDDDEEVQQKWVVVPRDAQELDTLASIAARHGMAADELQRANPSIRSVHEPIAPGTRVVIPARRDGPPQTVEEFARAHGTTTEEVLRHNPQFQNGSDRVDAGERVYVPARTSRPGAPSHAPPHEQQQQQQYQQQQQQQQDSGDTLASIAARHGMAADELQRANPSIRSVHEPIAPGTRVVIPARRDGPPQTVEQFARAHGTTTEEVLRHNPNLKSSYDVLGPDQSVQLAAAAPAPSQPSTAPAAACLGDLARQYNVPLEDLLAANPSVRGPYDPLPPGFSVALPPPRSSASVSDYARDRGVSEAEFLRHNPQYRSGGDTVHRDHQPQLPASTASAPLPSATKQVRVLNVTQPTTVAELARELNVQPEALLRYNTSFIGPNSRIAARSQVVLPPEATVSNAPRMRDHTVRQREYPAEVAERYGISEDELYRANPSLRQGMPVESGTIVTIPPPQQAASWTPPEEATVYRVRTQGDTLHAMSHRMGIPVEDLSAANDGLDPARPLSLNQPIFIPSPEQRRSTTTTTYRAQQADSLASIAHRHGIQVEELIDHNPSLRGAPAVVDGREYVIPPPRPAHHRAVPQQVVVEQRTTVSDISKQYGVSVEQILELNPSLNRSDPIAKGYSVRLPPPASTSRWEASNSRAVVHYSQSDETVDTIAHRYGVSADEIRRSNPGLAAQGYVPAGRRIVVREADARQTTSTTTTYVVADEGASVDRIAELHGVSAADLRAHNGWDDSFTRAGPQTRVVVPPPRRDEVWNQHGSRAVHYRAQAGESVTSVAYRHGVSVEHVRRCNPALRGDTIEAPQDVIIVESGAQREAPVHHVTHVVRQGDDMASVARAYGVDEGALRAANASRRFDVHQTIVIPPSHHSQSHSVYEVGPAETSREVAIRYGVEEHDLVAANPSVRFASGRRQQIVIPAAGQHFASEAQHFETVHVAPAAAHETPEMVAQRYGVGASDVARSNVAVDFESSMPSRIILPQSHAAGYSAPPPTAARRHTAAHVETYDVYERQSDESVDAVAERHGLPREAILALNPDFGRADSSVLLPPGSTQRAAERHGESDISALRRADAAETAVGNRDVLLDRYERVINDLQSGRAGDGRTAASQLEFLMHEYERVSEELQRCASANRAWEAHCRALGDAAGSKDEASLRHELARVATELHHAKAHFAEHERRVRSDMEREFTRRARVLDRAHREEAERLKAEMEHRLMIASGDTGDHASRSLQVSKNHSGAPRDSRHEGTPGYAGPTIADLEPFLQYKDDTHAKLVRDHQDLQQQYQLISARCTTLDEKFETMAFAIDSRPSLLKIVFDLHKLADASSQAVEDLALRLSVRDIPRRQLQQELGGIAADARDLARSHHWIIGNLFTEVEVMHLGASPAHYSNTVDPRLAVNAPAKNPLTPQKKKLSVGSPARGRSSTPVRVMRTTTTTTTTTIAKAPRPSTARGF